VTPAREASPAIPAPLELPQTRVAVYDSLRTAHLERAREHGMRIFYRKGSYDLDPDLLRLSRATRCTPVSLFCRVLTSRWQSVEVNEPLMLNAQRFTVAVSVAVAVRRLFLRRQVKLVAYAIENLDPTCVPSPPFKLSFQLRAAKLLLRNLQLLVYGTEQAHELYERLFGSLAIGKAHCTCLALPTPCPCLSESQSPRQGVFFLARSKNARASAASASLPRARTIPDASLLASARDRYATCARLGNDHGHNAIACRSST
jgi:hypothetical protein